MDLAVIVSRGGAMTVRSRREEACEVPNDASNASGPLESSLGDRQFCHYLSRSSSTSLAPSTRLALHHFVTTPAFPSCLWRFVSP